ncbi:hypothetical protein K2173_000932 [Erythroxylum novogranatense]|uniref:Zinc finger PHD-type domain-containing protein n=1 Tax=Erythroxylum novogranatense TaxID=1862640 RepID=A0AAV8TQJ0_9ROSI|nr:hypothetical protein K2173_000932 [Erythroxylum novogranatense]
MVVVNGRPMKRMKRRVTADLYDFLSFPPTDDHPRAPFRANVKSFLNEHALCPPPASLIPHLLTWQMSFRVGADSASAPAVSLDVVEEDVARSRSLYCDQCRVVGWSGHPVCTKRYHFIIKADGNSIGGYHKPCACCGEVMHFSESRCKTCNHITTTDDVEDWIYHQLEDTTHLLHAVVHANGYGHLLRVNGREGGSRVLSGCHIMDFWDRLCKTLGVRKISVMDVSKKYGLEYRLLHAITNGRSWYGNWGYEFGAGSFALTVDAYKSAIETLSSQSLCVYFSQGRKPRTRLQDKISFYQSLYDRELVNIRDLFCYLMSLIHSSRKSPRIDSSYRKLQNFKSDSPSLSMTDIERVEEAMLRVLRAVSGSNWVSWRALRGAVCKVATPELLDHCLKEIGGKTTADGMIVVTRCNHDSGVLEYRLEAGNQPSDENNVGHGSPVITCPSEENLVQDLRFLYESLLNPLTMTSYGPEATRSFAISSAEKLLDCKQFVKDYKPERAIAITNPLFLCINCHVQNFDQVEENGPNTPPEVLVLPPNATLSDLKFEATRALQDVYLIFRRFQAEELVGYSGVDDSTQVKLLLGSAEYVEVRGRCLGKHSVNKFRMERGMERWTVECSCGARDDDGERMLACDVCGVWQHTRCSGIPDSVSVPAKFICRRCRSSC